MKLICHIGAPRTGATFLQNSLFANPDWLAAHGLAYGEVLAPDVDHIPLTVICARPDRAIVKAAGIESAQHQQQARQQVSERIRSHQNTLGPEIHTTLFSSRHMMRDLRGAEEIAQLRDFLRAHFSDVKIVVYVRRQDDTILSVYGDHMRRGLSNEFFRGFVDTCLAPDGPVPFLYYRRELGKWVEAWGIDNIILRRFSTVDFIDENLMSDFLGVCLNTWSPDLGAFRPAARSNPGFSAPALELLRRLQPHLPGDPTAAPAPGRAKLLSCLREMPATPRPVMAAMTSRLIMTHFETANRWLKETFYPDLEGPFFPNRPDHPDGGNLGQADPQQMADMMEQVLARTLTT